MDWTDFFFKLYITGAIVALFFYMASELYSKSLFLKKVKKYGCPIAVSVSVFSMLAAIWAS